MNTKVLSIELTEVTGLFKVVVSIGENCYEFTMTAETDKMGDRQIHLINGDEKFWELFKFNQHLAQGLYKLTAKAYNGEAIEVPQDIGQFYADLPRNLVSSNVG
jgi:hypothetical protein